MSVYGLAPLGTGPGPFGGPGLISVRGVLPLTNTSFVVVFDAPPRRRDPQAVNTATNRRNYNLTPLDPTVLASDGTTSVPSGTYAPTRHPYVSSARVDRLDPEQVICETEALLEPRTRYRVTLSPSIRGQQCETFAGPNEFEFVAPAFHEPLRPTLVSEQRYRDLDYIIEPKPGETGMTYRFEATNDFAIADARTSLRKRLYRRLFASPGDFAWAPGYGVGLRVKALAKTGQLQGLSALVAEQAEREPDVSAASAEVRVAFGPSGERLIVVDLYVEHVDDRSVRLSFTSRT